MRGLSQRAGGPVPNPKKISFRSYVVHMRISIYTMSRKSGLASDGNDFVKTKNRQTYDSQDRASIAASRGKKASWSNF